MGSEEESSPCPSIPARDETKEGLEEVVGGDSVLEGADVRNQESVVVIKAEQSN